MIKLTDDRLQDILEYLEKDLVNCLYLYGDIVRYGIHDPNMTVWYSEKNGDLNCVIMKYFQGSHVFSLNNDYDIDEVVQHLNDIDVDRISSNGEIIRELHKRMKDRYSAEYGRTLKMKAYRRFKHDVAIEEASLDDVKGIVDLLMSHPLYTESYTHEQLYEELSDRIKRKIGRSFIIRDGDRIVAHDSYNLETDKYAISGLALVHDDFRKTFYGVFLESHQINTMIDEGKEMYAMLYEMPRVEGFLKMGNEDVAEYGKLIRI